MDPGLLDGGVQEGALEAGLDPAEVGQGGGLMGLDEGGYGGPEGEDLDMGGPPMEDYTQGEFMDDGYDMMGGMDLDMGGGFDFDMGGMDFGF